MKEGGPWFILVAGINGAGKSTFAQNHGTLFTGERGEDTMCRLQKSTGAGHNPWRICPGSGNTHRGRSCTSTDRRFPSPSLWPSVVEPRSGSLWTPRRLGPWNLSCRAGDRAVQNVDSASPPRSYQADLGNPRQEKSPVKTGPLECGRGESNSHSRKATRT